MSRTRKSSPFPSAYKVLSQLEESSTPTIPAPPLPELLDACRHDGVTCAGCGQFDDLGIDWQHALIMNDEGDMEDEWFCKICFKREISPQPYRYEASRLDHSEERPFSKAKKR